ncbi:hypothetical protein RB195_012808 [Necator americanus]|uniref:Uncharacterized protein n=1 Tax=Necator americanus TaxID=51031 RepID=A0ABR1DSP2_NECAM
MDECGQPRSQKVDSFSAVEQRADFWKVRIVRQCSGSSKVYLFPSLLEWFNERPQSVLNNALVKRESQLDIEIPEVLATSPRPCPGPYVNGDPLTLFVAGNMTTRPSSQDIVAHLQRSYLELYQRNGRELVSLIDASLLLNEASFARKISEENNYQHDLLQLHLNQSTHDKWDNHKTSVMLRLSCGGVPSNELWEAATITRLICDMMAGPRSRRRSAVAEMAASGLKLDAMVLAKLYFPEDYICEQLTRECSCLFQNTVNADVLEIVRLINSAVNPFFERRMLRCIDQLCCYRILRIDFALNEHAPLQRKLVGRLELAQHVRFVIADALAYRNFGAVIVIAENATVHLDKYSFFTGVEQIVYPLAMTLLSEAARTIFHAKPASIGWKKQSDVSDKLGLFLQRHPNGYIGGLVEMWLNRSALVDIAESNDVYRQRSLRSSIESIAIVLREDTTLNPICRGLLIFACDFVCSVLEVIFGRSCPRIDVLVENPYIDRHTGMSMIRKLSRRMLCGHPDERVLVVLSQLCPVSMMERQDASSYGFVDSKEDVLEARESVVDFQISKIPSSIVEPVHSSTASSEIAIHDRTRELVMVSDVDHNFCEGNDQSLRRNTCAYTGSSESDRCAPDNDDLAESEQSLDQNDVLSVAPSRSVCEQVETMMAGVKYCKERELVTSGAEQKIHVDDAEQSSAEEAGITFDVPPLESIGQDELSLADTVEVNAQIGSKSATLNQENKKEDDEKESFNQNHNKENKQDDHLLHAMDYGQGVTQSNLSESSSLTPTMKTSDAVEEHSIPVDGVKNLSVSIPKVFFTSPLDSDLGSSNTSSDDDIAAVLNHSLSTRIISEKSQTNPEGNELEIRSTTEEETKHLESRRNMKHLEQGNSFDHVGPVSDSDSCLPNSLKYAHGDSKDDPCGNENSCASENIQEQVGVESESAEDVKAFRVQKKFMSGGFAVPDSPADCNFGYITSKKEDTTFRGHSLSEGRMVSAPVAPTKVAFETAIEIMKEVVGIVDEVAMGVETEIITEVLRGFRGSRH